MLIAALVYVASCTVLMGLIPAAELARSTAPFADAVGVVLGPVAAGMIALAALTKATGTLGGWILLTAQTGKAGADRGLFPRFFGRVDRHGVPVPSLLIMAALMSAVVFATISPTLGEQFGELIEVSVIFCLMLYVYACIAVLVYPRWIASAASLGRYRPIAAAGLLFCLMVIAYADSKLLLVTGDDDAVDGAGVSAGWALVAAGACDDDTAAKRRARGATWCWVSPRAGPN